MTTTTATVITTTAPTTAAAVAELRASLSELRTERARLEALQSGIGTNLILAVQRGWVRHTESRVARAQEALGRLQLEPMLVELGAARGFFLSGQPRGVNRATATWLLHHTIDGQWLVIAARNSETFYPFGKQARSTGQLLDLLVTALAAAD